MSKNAFHSQKHVSILLKSFKYVRFISLRLDTLAENQIDCKNVWQIAYTILLGKYSLILFQHTLTYKIVSYFS